MLVPTKGVDYENVEQGVHKFKNVIFDQTVSICYWHKHRMFEIVVELYLNATIANQGILMRLECAIENVICEGGAALRRLVRVC
jgi:hypothetical protein